VWHKAPQSKPTFSLFTKLPPSDMPAEKTHISSSAFPYVCPEANVLANILFVSYKMASKKGVVFAPPNIALCVQSWNMMKSFTLQEENEPHFECFSLCLSRACLGKIADHLYTFYTKK
jgi:hypothetical protein